MENTDDRFYTPELSEFHLGFEYEAIGQNGTWIAHKFPSHELGIGNYNWTLSLKVSIDCKQVRVKKLSRECIEELGWVKSGNETAFFWKIHPKGHFPLYVLKIIGDGWVEIEDDGGIIIYRGLCRNKSHLSRLMKDLGIIQ